MAETATQEERKVQQLEIGRFKEADYRRQVYVATAHENTEPEDLLDTKYFAHVAETLKPFDRIEVRADDGTWFVELLVIDAGRNWAKVHMLTKHKLVAKKDDAGAESLNPYEVKYAGPHAKWRVIRKVDNAVVHEGEETKEGAEKWRDNRIKAER